MKPAFVCLLLALGLVATVGCQKSPVPLSAFSPGDHYLNVNAGGLQRHYIVHVPQGYDGQKSLPVVIVLHGGGGTAKGTMEMTGMADKADQAGFLAVFPEGTTPFPSQPPKFSTNPQLWNDGSGRGHAGKRNVDDIVFINALLDDLVSKFNVGQQRIFATGFSNGASMTFRVGAELSHRIAAIAPVSGHYWLPVRQLRRPVPLLYIIGTEDPLNPLKGGEVALPWGTTEYHPPVQDSLLKWIQMMGCLSEPQVLSDKDGVKVVAYKPCNEGSEIIYYTVAGLGHNWPGGKPYLPQSIVGKISHKIIANDVIWDFFQEHFRK